MKTLFILTIAALVLAGCASTPAPTPQTWAYRTRTSKERIGKKILDQYGRTGWELVQVDRISMVRTNASQGASTNLEYQYIFKRPKP